MGPLEGETRAWRFGVFQIDSELRELRRNGSVVKLRDQSARILLYLLGHAGELVTREELRQMLWESDTYVDFDHSMNTAVMKLREALGDPAGSPLYIQTIPRRGYRFIAPVVPILLPGKAGRGESAGEEEVEGEPAADDWQSEPGEQAPEAELEKPARLAIEKPTRPELEKPGPVAVPPPEPSWPPRVIATVAAVSHPWRRPTLHRPMRRRRVAGALRGTANWVRSEQARVVASVRSRDTLFALMESRSRWRWTTVVVLLVVVVVLAAIAYLRLS